VLYLLGGGVGTITSNTSTDATAKPQTETATEPVVEPLSATATASGADS